MSGSPGELGRGLQPSSTRSPGTTTPRMCSSTTPPNTEALGHLRVHTVAHEQVS